MVAKAGKLIVATGLGVLVIVAVWNWPLQGRTTLANKLVVAGNVREWRENTSRPLPGVEIIVLREGKVIGTATSKDNGSFSTEALPEGSPVVVLFRKKGYVEGKLICCHGDDAEGKIPVTLLRETDAKSLWGDDAEKIFRAIDLKLSK